MSTINKSFIIDFDETAIDKHAVPASSVAQSLLSLLALLQSISKQLFGKQSVAEVNDNVPGVWIALRSSPS